MLRNAAADSRIKAVVLEPRGLGVGWAKLEEIRDDILTFKKSGKPVYAYLRSAGTHEYYVASAADRIFAPRNAIVGSIGVIFQYPNVSELLKRVGVAVEEVKSTPLKAAPNGYEPTSPEAKAAIRGLVEDSYGWFKGLVRERRSLDDAKLNVVSDGRVFTAHQALPLNLIDEMCYPNYFLTAWDIVRWCRHKDQKIRVTGYLMWDDDHNGSADVGSTIQYFGTNGFHHPWRSTAWEIHPIMKIEVME